MKPNVKTTLTTSGTVEIDSANLSNILIAWVQEEISRKLSLPNREVVSVRLQWPKDGSKRVVALFEAALDEGAKPFGAPPKPPKETKSYEGKSHKWEGFYSSVGEVLDEQRKRGKKFISYSDLLAELHDMQNNKGEKLFVKGGESLPMSVLRHRLAPSQIVRQSKGQPNLRSVKNDKKNGGLSIG